MGLVPGETEWTYMYFISTSRTSVPPSDSYMRFSIGDISDCRIDWSISITVASCISYKCAQISS